MYRTYYHGVSDVSVDDVTKLNLVTIYKWNSIWMMLRITYLVTHKQIHIVSGRIQQVHSLIYSLLAVIPVELKCWELGIRTVHTRETLQNNIRLSWWCDAVESCDNIYVAASCRCKWLTNATGGGLTCFMSGKDFPCVWHRGNYWLMCGQGIRVASIYLYTNDYLILHYV